MSTDSDGFQTPLPYSYEAAKDREFWFPNCQNRCTQGTDGTEYGHAGPRNTNGPCPRRPATVNPGRNDPDNGGASA